MASGGEFNTEMLSDETFDLLCTVCKHKGKNTEAEKFCTECHDYYCATCVKVHSEVPPLLGHKILDKGQFPLGSSQGQLMAPTEKCNKHSHKPIDMYCQNHDVVGCSTCMAADHRVCQDIFYITEFLKNYRSAVDTREIQLKLEAVATTLTEHTTKFQQEKQDLLNKKAELLDIVRRFRKEINDRLDELEKKSIRDIEDKFKALVSKTEEAMKQLQANKAAVSASQDRLSPAHTNEAQEFVSMKMSQNAADEATECIEHNKMGIQAEDHDFMANEKIQYALLEEMNALGKVTERNTKAVEKKYAIKTQQKKDSFQIKRRRIFPIKTKSDSITCDIVSACALEDGTIILSDSPNMKLKRFNGYTNTITDYLVLPSNPWQVCAIDKQVAVSLRGKQEVHFILVASRMTTINTMKTDFKCHGLAYANSHLYIADESSSVYVYTESGRKLQKFSKDQSGQRIFSDIISLAVSKDASRIYVTDFNNGFITLDNNGVVIKKFSSPQLQGASGCYLTETGNVLVCGQISKNVLQFGINGELIRNILKFPLKGARPEAICCNQQMSKMIISMHRTDNIEVYDIQKV